MGIKGKEALRETETLLLQLQNPLKFETKESFFEI